MCDFFTPGSEAESPIAPHTSPPKPKMPVDELCSLIAGDAQSCPWAPAQGAGGDAFTEQMESSSELTW